MYGESNMETYITICKIDSQWEFPVWLRKLKQGLCINLEGWDGEGDGREFQKGGDICIPMADSVPGGSDGKYLPAMQRPGFNPWVGKISWRRKWQPTPVFLPGKSHGWRSLVGYSTWGRKSWTRLSNFTFHG